MELKVGDKVVYPNQGVCRIESISTRSIAGRQEEFYVLKLLLNSSTVSHGSTVMIPVSNVQNVGLRRLSNQSDIRDLFSALETCNSSTDPDWKSRYKDNLEKMKSGCIFEVGRVLQDLYCLSFQKPLSFREKKMYDRARQLVVSEIATVTAKALSEVEASVERSLQDAYEQLHAAAPS